LHAARYISVTNQGIRYLLEVLMIGGVAIVIFGATVAGSASGALVVIGVLLAGGLRLVPALNTLLIAVNNVRGNVSAVAIVEDEMSRLGVASTGDLSTTTATGVELTGGVRLQDVSVLYPGRTTPALDSLSLDIGRGQTIGVVGASGAGKSTLVDVILGLLEPTSGRVLLDKRELKSCLADWRSTIGFVPQEIFLMDASLEANIRLGHPRNESSGSRLTEAIRLAQLTDVVEQLPEGVDTLVGERGLRLSGGQRQRIGLARALYGRPSFLILDEATSALDNQTEKLIGQALRSLHGKLTMLVIAHRLSTVRACDRIAFLDDGKLVACAPFDELLVTNRKFADLVRLGSVDQEFL
jgi:ABC-type multidrug transport system fused ATPase/permease subunit